MLTWVTCPIVRRDGVRVPLVGTLRDPSQPIVHVERTILPPGQAVEDEGGLATETVTITPTFAFSAGIGARDDHCVALVRADDVLALAADGRVRPLLPDAQGRPIPYDAQYLDGSADGHGWAPGQRAALRGRLQALGADATGLTDQAPLWQWIERAGKAVAGGNFRPRGTWVGAPGRGSRSSFRDEAGVFWLRRRARPLVRDRFGRRVRSRRAWALAFGTAAAMTAALQDWFPGLSVLVIGQLVDDTFTEGSNTDLDAHTPDTGDGWTEEDNSFGGSVRALVDAGSDTARSSHSVNVNRLVYSAQPDPTGNEYDIECDLSHDGTTGRPIGLVARHAGGGGSGLGATGYYGLLDATGDNPDAEIYKIDGGTATSLATGNFGDNNAVFKFEIRDAAKKWFAGATERLSTTDDAVTASGHWGLCWGSVVQSEDLDLDHDADDFTCTMVGGAFTLDAAAGSFAVTGTAADVLRGAVLEAVAGTLTISGTVAGLLRGAAIDAESGAVTISGTAAGLLRGARIDAASGAVVVTGTAAAVLRGALLSAETGSFADTGTAAGLLAGRVLAADPGSTVISGTAADLRAAYQLVAASGAYVITGTAADLVYSEATGFVLTADPGSFALTGTVAELLRGAVLAADAGSVAISGTAAGVFRGAVLSAEAGAVSIGGPATGLLVARLLPAEAGAFSAVGTDAGVLVGRVILAESGAYVVTGVDAGLITGYYLAAGGGVWAWTGTNATLTGSAEVQIDVINATEISVAAPDAASVGVTAPDATGTGVTTPDATGTTIDGES